MIARVNNSAAENPYILSYTPGSEKKSQTNFGINKRSHEETCAFKVNKKNKDSEKHGRREEGGIFGC